jgi:hypothetical protein
MARALPGRDGKAGSPTEPKSWKGQLQDHVTEKPPYKFWPTRRTTEIDVAIHALNRMLKLGRLSYIRVI